MKPGGRLPRRAEIRGCGKPYKSAEEAGRSKDVLVNGHEVVEGCPCGFVHTEKPKATADKRMPLRPQGSSSDISPAVRKLVLERDGYCCVCCGRSIMGQRYSLGHRVRAGQGGPATPENLVTLLGWGGEACHGRIDLYKDKTDGIGVKGYRLPSGTDPAMEPVLIVSGDADAFLAWLTADGRYSAKPPREVAA